MEEQVVRDGVSGLYGLLREVAGQERDYLARHSGVDRLRLRSPARIQRRPRVPLWPLLLPALGAVAALTLWWSTNTPAPVTFAIGDATGTATPGHAGDALAAGATKLPVRFSDGSFVELGRGAEAHVARLDREGATVRIDRGEAQVSVKHRAHTHWKFEAGPFEVQVTGTRFAIAWDGAAEAVTVAMSEGSVEIRSRHRPDAAPVRVVAGQRFSASQRQPRWTIESVEGATLPSEAMPGAPEAPPAAAPPSAAAVASVKPNDSAAGKPAVGARVDGAPGARVTDLAAGPAVAGKPERLSPERMLIGGTRHWQVLAARGRYQDALDTVERSGGFAATCRRLGSEPLVQLGDVARLAHDAGRAKHAYQLARKRFPAEDRPTFGLGLLAFEQQHDYAAAAYWFERYLQQFPSGPLATEAAGRAMEAWRRAGDEPRAAAAARTYLSTAPTGPYAPLARQIANP